MSASIPEAAFQRRITDLASLLGLRWHHETDSRRSKAGFPDLVLVGPAGVLHAELKTDRGRISGEQQKWLDAINAAGGEAHLWRPNDWPTIQARLKELAGRP